MITQKEIQINPIELSIEKFLLNKKKKYLKLLAIERLIYSSFVREYQVLINT